MRASRQGQREWSRLCAACGYARINVRHNVTPESQVEGREYYARMTDLHEFVLSDRFSTLAAPSMRALRGPSTARPGIRGRRGSPADGRAPSAARRATNPSAAG